MTLSKFLFPIILFFISAPVFSQSSESWNFENYPGVPDQNCKKFKTKNPEGIWMRNEKGSYKIFDVSGRFDGCQLQDGKFYYFYNKGPGDYSPLFYIVGDLTGGKMVSGEIKIKEAEYNEGKYKFTRLKKNGEYIDKIEINGDYKGLAVSGTAIMTFKNNIPVDIYYDSIHWNCPDGTTRDSLIRGNRSSKDLPLGRLVYKNGDEYIGELDIPGKEPRGKGILYKKNGTKVIGYFDSGKITISKSVRIVYPDNSYTIYRPKEREFVETDLILPDGSKRKQAYLMDSLVADEGTPAWDNMLAERKKKEIADQLAKKKSREHDSITAIVYGKQPNVDIHCVTFILKKTTGTINVSVYYSAIYIQIEDHTQSATENMLMSEAKKVMQRDINLNGYQIEKEFLDQADCQQAKKVVNDSGLEISDFRVLYGSIEN